MGAEPFYVNLFRPLRGLSVGLVGEVRWRLAISCSNSAAKPSTEAGSSNTMSRLNEMAVWSLSTGSSEIVAT